MSVNIENLAPDKKIRIFFLFHQKYNIQYSKTIFKSSSEAPFLRKKGKLKISLNSGLRPSWGWFLTSGHFQNTRTKNQKLIHSSSLTGLLHNSQSFFQAIFYLDLGFLSISYTRAKKIMFHALMTPWILNHISEGYSIKGIYI